MAAHDDFTCKDFSEAVTDYIELGLDSEQRKIVDRHLSLCPPCRAYLAQMRRTIATIGSALSRRTEPGDVAGPRAIFRAWRGSCERRAGPPA